MLSCLKYLPYRAAIAVTRQEVVRAGCERRFKGRAKVGVPQALKGTGDPTVMRRLVDIMDADDDVDDDFLAEDAKGSSSSVHEPSPREMAQPDPDNPKHVKIRTSQYVGSATKLDSCPQDGRPEFAIIGRSNVGKSSLINMLTKNKNLALTSKQPGIASLLVHICVQNGTPCVLPPAASGMCRQDQVHQPLPHERLVVPR